MCECYQIGGRFIAEDPDCPVHGTDAQMRQQSREERLDALVDRVHVETDIEELRELALRIADLTR